MPFISENDSLHTVAIGLTLADIGKLLDGYSLGGEGHQEDLGKLHVIVCAESYEDMVCQVEATIVKLKEKNANN